MDHKMNKFRNWVFTLNNYTEDEVKAIDEIACRYCIYGKEVGAEGTPHLQGTIVFKSQLVFSSIKTLLPERCHIEACKALPESIVYCKKENNFIERGDKPMSAKEKGLSSQERWGLAYEQAKRDGDVEDQQIRFSHARTIQYIYNLEKRKVQHMDTDDKHLWYYGETGTGKSRKAREENPGAYKKLANKWWDNYVNQDVVIMEDIDSSHEYMGYLVKLWADRYPFPVEIKGGGGHEIRPKLIIITSNFHPSEIWSDDKILNPILRRFKVTKFGSLDLGSSSLGL